MNDAFALSTLLPIIVFLSLGVAAAVTSHAIRLSPIVGYIALGFALKGSSLSVTLTGPAITTLSQIGVVFLLFDVGLHFSLKHIRDRASDIFAFGPVQVLFATLALGLVAWLWGLSPLAALLVGAIISNSSTAVVARLIAERHQQNCPVGLTATAILIFQDVSAIGLLIIASSPETTQPIAMTAAIALGKAAVAFAIAVFAARTLVRPILALVTRSRNEEVFTATALLVALAAAWATGLIGLSLTLGAFLGGLTLSETPYRAVIQAEIKPFRGLFLGFFFIYVGFSLDAAILRQFWFQVLCVTFSLLAVKALANILASRIFRWSIPGSTQLGILISQGSELAFVILGLPAVRTSIGETRCSILMAAVTLSMAATPSLAEFARSLAGYLRRRMERETDPELTPTIITEPVIIVGMGRIGRSIADVLIEFSVDYCGLERDSRRLRRAIADGYNAQFGDGSDIRLWEPVDLHQRKISILTAPDLDEQMQMSPIARANYPDLKRFAVVSDEITGEQLRSLGITPIVERNPSSVFNTVAAVLLELGHSPVEIDSWTKREVEKKLDPSSLAAIPA